ncbi:MAG TPA: tripartite tricarboxylate transporter TctB family protein [Burkholderiales bacterium]|nr:tripartite tricarboxylate transporter TctB family protein [Burkholderiales bacterium]
MPRTASLGLSLLIMLVAGYAVFAASAWPWKAALFPLAIGVPLFCLAAAEFLWSLLGPAHVKEAVEGDPELEGATRRMLVAAGWMVGFLAAIVLLGFPIAVPLFLLLYLKLQGGEGWVLSVVITVVTSAIFYGLFDAMLHLPFPAGLLFSWLGLA